MTNGDRDRLAACKRRGLDVMYAEANATGYETWTYSDGRRVRLRPMATLEGLQKWAGRNGFGIVYVD